MEKVEIDLKTANDIKTALEQEIKDLEKKRDNIESQQRDSQVRNEGDRKLEVHSLRKKEYELEKKNKIELEKIASVKEMVNRESEKLNDRIKEIEKREQELLGLEDKRKSLMQERGRFNEYKIIEGKKLEKAQIIIAEAEGFQQSIDTENEQLSHREKSVKSREKYWNDKIGELEEDKKLFQIQKENKEVVNV